MEDCLYKKLVNTPYHAISVSDICSEVGVSRRSFYHYFEDKDDCLCSVVDRAFRKYMLEATAIPKELTDLEKATALMELWKKGSMEFLGIMAKNRLLEVVTMRAIHFVREEEKKFAAPISMRTESMDDDVLSVYVASDLALLMCWYRRGFDTPSEEMAKKYLRIIQKV